MSGGSGERVSTAGGDASGIAASDAMSADSKAAVALLIFGMFLVVVDTTIVNVALPVIADDLGVTSGIEWLVTAYFLALAVVQPVTGWLTGRFGLRSTFLGALGGFVVLAGVAASAPNFGVLVVARPLQGALGGLVLPVSTAIFFEVVPRDRRGTVVGISGTVVALGPAVAPFAGGALVSTLGWRWLLFAGVPAGAACVVTAWRYLPAVGVRERRPFDVVGLLLGAGGLTALLLGLSEGSRWGWSAPQTLGSLVAAPLLLTLFARRSRRVVDPLVRPILFRQVPYLASLGIIWAAAVAWFGGVVFVPVQLQVLRGMSPFEAGSVVATMGVMGAVAMPFAGRWTDRVGARVPVTGGAVVLALGALRLATLDLSTPVWQIVAGLAVLGLGRVLVTVPATVEGLNVVSDRLPEPLLTEAASVRTLNRQVSAAVVTAGLAALVTARAGSLDPGMLGSDALEAGQVAYNQIFFIAIAGAASVPFLARLLLPSTRRGDGEDARVGDEGARPS